jgi:transcriptional regulator with XRE-family HTH domain
MAKLNLPSEILKQRRLDLGLTQADLAARAGIEQSQVSKIERSLDVRLSTFMRLLTALDLDLLLLPRTRPGAIVGTINATLPPLKAEMRGAIGQPPHFDVPFQHPKGHDYPIAGTSDRFRPKTGTLLERFAIPDDEDDVKSPPPRPGPALPPTRSRRSAPAPPRARKK